jgi:hypothetical protein
MLKAGVMSYDYTPLGEGQAVHKDVTYELEQYPEDKTEERLEKHVAPAVRYHMKDFLAAIASRGKPVADIEQGHISTASCILANLSMDWPVAQWDPVAQRCGTTKRQTAAAARVPAAGCIPSRKGLRTAKGAGHAAANADEASSGVRSSSVDGRAVSPTQRMVRCRGA